jgi:hypothetical protein
VKEEPLPPFDPSQAVDAASLSYGPEDARTTDDHESDEGL